LILTEVSVFEVVFCSWVSVFEVVFCSW